MEKSIDENNIGEFYTTDKRDIWQLVSFCHHPTVTLENMETGEVIGGTIGSLNLKPFVRLVGEDYRWKRV